MSQQLSTNTFGCAKWIVDPTSSQGTHTTISAALTSASSGDTIFIRPGTYTENLTLKAGVNLTAYTCDAFTPNVTISGTCTLTAAGTISISGIRLQTNSAALLAVTGSAASIVNIDNCYLNCTNNTGITFSTSSASAQIIINNCKGNLGTTGIGLFSHSSAGTLNIMNSNFTNTGASTTASTASSGTLSISYSQFTNPITTSSTNSFGGSWSFFNTAAINTTALTVGGSGINFATGCAVATGSATSISVGSNLQIVGGGVNSTNASAIAGAGTLTYSDIGFINTSSTITTTTLAGTFNQFGAFIAKKQPAFLGLVSGSNIVDVTGDGTTYTVVFNSESTDQASNFNTATGIFTAPVTGIYNFNAAIYCTGYLVGHTQQAISLVIGGTTYLFNVCNPVVSINTGNNSFLSCGSITVPMTAAQTAQVNLTVSGSTKVIDVLIGSWFSGSLEC